MRFAHTLKAVTQKKVAAVVYNGGVHELIFCHIDSPPQAKPWHHLQVVRRTRAPFFLVGDGLAVLAPRGRGPSGWWKVLLTHVGWIVGGGKRMIRIRLCSMA